MYANIFLNIFLNKTNVVYSLSIEINRYAIQSAYVHVFIIGICIPSNSIWSLLKVQGQHSRRAGSDAHRKMEEHNLSVVLLEEYDFEKQFNGQEAIQWMQENWGKSFFFSVLYAAIIFWAQRVMKERKRFELRRPLVLWSLALAVFSIIGAVRTGYYLSNLLLSSGFKQSICDRGFYNGPVSKFWAYAFVLSKVPELGDTLFIVLRKQKLIFLHWYHHITVLLYTWYTYKDTVAGGGWFMTMNYTVHAFMYSYYTLRAAGIQVPRLCAMFITMTQILQMVMGTFVNVLVYRWMQDGTCSSTPENIFWSIVMYSSYLVLFCSFFYNAYMKTPAKSKAE